MILVTLLPLVLRLTPFFGVMTFNPIILLNTAYSQYCWNSARFTIAKRVISCELLALLVPNRCVQCQLYRLHFFTANKFILLICESCEYFNDEIIFLVCLLSRYVANYQCYFTYLFLARVMFFPLDFCKTAAACLCAG